MNCCRAPKISNFSYDRNFTNKYCHTCGSHLYGAGNGLLINKKDWEEWVNSPGDGISFEEYQKIKPGQLSL